MNEVREEWASLAGMAQVLAGDPPRPAQRLRRTAVWLSALILVAFGSVAFYLLPKGSALHYVTQAVRRGNLVVTVTAAGTMHPTRQVDVGSELAGTVRSVEVDYNDTVQVGQVLAKLDRSRLDSQVLQSKAALDSAAAGLQQAEAAATAAQGDFNRLRHVRELSAGEVPSQQEYASARTTLSRARAAVLSARAAVVEARATLESQQADLDRALIRSPVNGIVLTRAVAPGQAVAPSLQAPALFTLAEDLSRMQLVIDVDEADIGQVRAGQDATFLVDAWPDKTFPAKVTQVRYGAKTMQGVVTYEAVLSIDNAAHLLRPGMTATATIVVDRVDNGILVPNAALRYEPPARGERPSGGLLRSLLSKHQEAPTAETDVQPPGSQAHVWVLRDGRPVRVRVDAGRSDGAWTEVRGAGLTPGTSVIVDTAGTSA